MKNLNNYNKNFIESEEVFIPHKTIKSLAKIFNISESEVRKNKHLFCNIEPYIAQSIEYLSEIDSDNLKLSAALSLNYLINYNESAFE